MNIAQRTRLDKEIHPERYCATPRCLWALRSGPCPRHQADRRQPLVERIARYSLLGDDS